MIKAIVMIYIFIVFLVLNLTAEQLEIKALTIGGAFGAGMFCYRFISLSNGGDND